MALRRIRPRFEMIVPASSTEILEQIAVDLNRDDAPYKGDILDRHLQLMVHEHERHYWSPHLQVDVERHEEGTLLRGLFGPHPDVWTLFVALYAMTGFLGMVGLLYGFSQWTLGNAATALWAVPVAGLLGIGLYLSALVGQQRGHDQMDALRAFVEQQVQKVLSEKEKVQGEFG